MNRIHNLKLCCQYQCLKTQIDMSSSTCKYLIRHLSHGCRPINRNFSSASNQFQPKEKIIFNGIVQSPFPDIEEVSSDCTVDKFVWEHLDHWPNHVAVECGVTGQKYTYSELRILCQKFATSLQKRGYRPGQVLSVMLPNSPDYIIVTMGAIEAGMIVSPINPVYTPYELSHQLHENRAAVLVTQPNLISKLNAAVELIKSNHKTDCKIDAIVTSTNSVTPIPSGVINLKDMLSDDIDHNELRFTNRSSKDVVFLPYSSGTTGLSKGVQLTHKNCVGNVNQLDSPDSSHFHPTTNDHQDVIPAILPFFHIYAATCVLTRGLRKGVKLITLPKFEATPFFSILKNHRANILYAVPPIILLLGNHPRLTDEHMASLRLIMTGAGPISASDAERILSRFKSNYVINQAYGLTETSPATMVGSQNENEYSSVGRPVRSTYVKIIKPDGGIAAPMEVGEICIKGPQVMLGYLNKPEATKEVIDDEQFFHSGDVGYYDECGRFYVVDRMKELIKVKGFQVPPAELEALLRTHEEVTEAAVIGIPDDRTGEKPMAFVVTKNKNTVMERELIEFVSSKVAPYKQLAKVEIVDEIPKSPSGKILKRYLREKFTSRN